MRRDQQQHGWFKPIAWTVVILAALAMAGVFSRPALRPADKPRSMQKAYEHLAACPWCWEHGVSPARLSDPTRPTPCWERGIDPSLPPRTEP